MTPSGEGDESEFEPTPESLRQQFGAIAELMHQFLEWRHRVMTRFVAVIGALGLSVRWLYDEDKPRFLKILALSATALFCAATAEMDRVNQTMLNISYKTGRAVERELGAAEVGMFHAIDREFGQDLPYKWRSYRRLLQAIYWGVGAIAAGWAFLVAIRAA